MHEVTSAPCLPVLSFRPSLKFVVAVAGSTHEPCSPPPFLLPPRLGAPAERNSAGKRMCSMAARAAKRRMQAHQPGRSSSTTSARSRHPDAPGTAPAPAAASAPAAGRPKNPAAGAWAPAVLPYSPQPAAAAAAAAAEGGWRFAHTSVRSEGSKCSRGKPPALPPPPMPPLAATKSTASAPPERPCGTFALLSPRKGEGGGGQKK